ncbi:hypothetical protein [Aquibacillus kalidii]|uniref:hypothetical protein n=1 Tax=Aquibacillus kalidii TaxID=2762597 RepID=UPI001647188D|nr:hypothetical protein [Aquibacillus kalidii]
MKKRHYNVDPGYVTITEASEIVSNILRLTKQDSQTYKTTIREGAKNGLFGGKKYKKKMYQVKRADIYQFAHDLKREEQLALYNIEIAPNLDNINKTRKLPIIDTKTAQQIIYCIKYLRLQEIISDEVYQKAERNLILRTAISGAKLG